MGQSERSLSECQTITESSSPYKNDEMRLGSKVIHITMSSGTYDSPHVASNSGSSDFFEREEREIPDRSTSGRHSDETRDDTNLKNSSSYDSNLDPVLSLAYSSESDPIKSPFDDEILEYNTTNNPSIHSLVGTVVVKDYDDYVDTSPLLGSTSPKQSDTALSQAHELNADCDKCRDHRPSDLVESLRVNQTLEGDKNVRLGNDPNPSIEDDDECRDDVVFIEADGVGADIDTRSDLLRDIVAPTTESLALDNDLQSPEHGLTPSIIVHVLENDEVGSDIDGDIVPFLGSDCPKESYDVFSSADDDALYSHEDRDHLTHIATSELITQILKDVKYESDSVDDMLNPEHKPSTSINVLVLGKEAVCDEIDNDSVLDSYSPKELGSVLIEVDSYSPKEDIISDEDNNIPCVQFTITAGIYHVSVDEDLDKEPILDKTVPYKVSSDAVSQLDDTLVESLELDDDLKEDYEAASHDEFVSSEEKAATTLENISIVYPAAGSDAAHGNNLTPDDAFLVTDDEECESFEAKTTTGDRYAFLSDDNTKFAILKENAVATADRYTVAFSGNSKNPPCDESLSANVYHASFDATTITTANHDDKATSMKVVSFEEVFCSPSMATPTHLTKPYPDSLTSSFSTKSGISKSSDSSKLSGSTMDRYAESPSSTTPPRSVSSTKNYELMKSQVMECSEKFQPRIFLYSNGCERCLSLLSDHERAKYEKNGNSPLVTVTSGGCHESCQFFKGIHGKGGVRLCMRCFQSLHKPLFDTLKVRDEGICDRSRSVSCSRSSPTRSSSRGRSASRGRGIME